MNDINILIKGLLDSAGSIKDINAAIHKLSNNPNLRKLKLKTEIDQNVVNDYTKQIEKLQQQVNKMTKNDKGVTLIDGTQIKEATKLHQEVDEIVASYKKMNDVKDIKVFKSINDQTGQVEEFIVQVNKANDVVEKFKYNLTTQQTGDNQFSTAYVMDDIVKQIDSSDKQLKKQREEMDNAILSTLQKREQKEREWNEAQSKAIAKNAEIERKEIDEIEEKRLQTIANREQREKEFNQAQQLAVWKNFEEEKKLAEEMANFREQSEERVKKDTTKWDSKQIEYENKALEENAQKQKTLIGTYRELKSSQLESRDVSKILSRQFGDLEIREQSLDQVTGKYSVTLRKSAKENLVLKGSIDKVTGALHVQSQKLETARTTQLGMMEQFKIAAQRVPVWLGATTLYFQSFAFIRQLVTDIVDINEAMIELGKVAEATDDELKSFMYTAPEVGKKLGVLTKDVINTTASISKLGYTLKEASELSELSLLGQVVGDLDSVDDSVSYLTSTLKGFRLETSEASQVVDFFNNVANTSSVNYENLGEGMKRASAALSEANNSLSQSTGLLVAGFDVTRDAEKTATALRTTALRIRGVGEEGEDLSELVPTLEKKFARFGLTLKQDDKTFKSTYDIFKDLSEIWNDISDMERASILEDIAGKRNANVIAAVISNFEQAQVVMERYNTSAGSAWEEHKKYAEGVDFAYKNLLNTMTQLNQKLLDSKTIVDTLNMASSFVGNVAALGKFNIAILASVAAIGLFTTSTRKAILASQDFTTTVSVGGIRGFANGLKTATLSLLGIGSAAKGATFSMVALNTAMTGLLIGIPLLAQGIGYLIRKRAESLEQNVESIKTLSDETKAIDELVTQIEYLQGIGNKNAQQKEELITLEKRLASILPESTTKYDEQNNALATNLDLVRSLNKEKKENMLSEATAVVAKLEPDIENLEKELEIAKQMRDIVQEQIVNKRNGESVIDKRGNIVSLEDLGEALDHWNSKIKDSSEEINKYNAALEVIKLIQNDLKQSTEEYNKSQSDEIKTINDLIQAQKNQLMSLAEIQQKVSESSSEIDLLNKAQQEMQEEGYLSQETLDEMVKKYEDFIKVTGLSSDSIVDFINVKRDEKTEFINTELAKTDNLIEQTKKRIEAIRLERDEVLKLMDAEIKSGAMTVSPELEKVYRRLQGKETDYTSQLDQLKNNQSYLTYTKSNLTRTPSTSSKSSSTTKDTFNPYIVDAYANSIDKLDLKLRESEGRMSSLSETSQEYRNELLLQIQLYKQKQDITHKEANSIRDENSLIEKRLKNEKLTKEQRNELIEQLDKNNQKLRDLQSAWWDYNDSVSAANKSIQDSVQSLTDEYDKWLDGVRDIADDVVDTMKEAYEKQKELALATIDAEIDALEDSYDRKMEMLDDELSKYEEIINAKQKEIDLEAEKEDYQKRLTNAQKEAQDIQNKINILTLAANSGDISAKAQIEDLSKQLADKQIEITEMQDEHTRDIRKQNLQNQLEMYRQDIEAKKNAEDQKYEKVKSRLEREKEELQWHYDEIINNERHWAEVRDEIIAGNIKNIETELQNSLKKLKGYNEDTVKALNQSYQTLLSNIASVKSALNSLGEIDYNNKPLDMKNEILYLKNLYTNGSSGEKSWAKQQAQSYGVDITKYHDGGIVGNRSSSSIGGVLDKLLNTNADETVIKALKGELYSPQHNFSRYFVPNLQKLIGNIGQPSITPVTVKFDNLLQIDNFNNKSETDVNRLIDVATDRFFQKLKPYGFNIK